MSDVLPKWTPAVIQGLPFGPELGAIMLLRGELEYDAASTGGHFQGGQIWALRACQ